MTDSFTPVFGSRRGFVQHVTGNLLAHELVVRHIGVERTHDVIAELVSVRNIGFEFVAPRSPQCNGRGPKPVACPPFLPNAGDANNRSTTVS